MKNNNENDLISSGDEDEGGQGGQTGAIQFRYQDPFAEKKRDDALPPSEIKRLLTIHNELHKERVDKQKLTRKDRKALKEGKLTATAQYQQNLRQGRGGSGGFASRFKSHPISNKAQFSGIDRQVVAIPSENKAETNEEQRNELENRLLNRMRHTPKFNPKPSPF